MSCAAYAFLTRKFTFSPAARPAGSNCCPLIGQKLAQRSLSSMDQLGASHNLGWSIVYPKEKVGFQALQSEENKPPKPLG